jgi:hypothetical protein
MSDLPLPHPLDDQAAALLDAGLDAPAGDPALAARLAELRAVRDALADLGGVTPAPDPARRERSILAALAEFDEQAGAPAAPAPVVPIGVAAERRAARHTARTWLPAVAAAAVLMVGVLGVRQISRTSGGDETGSSALTSGLAEKNAAIEAARTADAAGDAASATTAAAAATTRAASASTAAGGAATTSAAVFATTTAPTRAPSPTSAGASTVAAPFDGLPYLGEIGSRAELDRAYTTLTGSTTPPTAASVPAPGQDARKAAAESACPIGSLGQTLALLRWQGRVAVLVLGERVRVVAVDDCTVVYERPA